MSKQSIKATIDAQIKQNGVQAITGQVMNSVLNQMVDNLAEEASTTEKLSELESDFRNRVNIDGSILLHGKGAQSFTTTIRLKKDRIYKVVPSKTSWVSSEPQGHMIMALYAYTDGVESTIFRYAVGNEIPSEILVDTTNSNVDYYLFGWRGDVGVEMSVDFIETNPTIDNSLLDRVKLVGEGNKLVKRYIKLNSNKKFEITPSKTDWAISQAPNDGIVLGLYKVLDGIETRVIGYHKGNTIPQKIFFDASEHDADYYYLGWRGDEGVQMSVNFIESSELSKLSKDDFAIGSLSFDGNVNYACYDTISSKGYYNVSKLGFVAFKVDGDVRKRISWYDAEFNLLSVTEWITDEVISIPNNASYCKIGIRPYENGQVKHSSDNIISTDLADEVVSNLPTMEFANNIKNVHSTIFKVGFNIPSVSNLVVVAKAETSATLSINYYTRTKKYSFCSNCVIGNKREVVNLMLPPIMYDGNAFEVVIDGKCDIELLNVEPINIQSHDTHIRVSAHLGYRLYFPENTKLSYKMAAMCGMWGSVANVHETSDGGLICYHQNDARLSEDGKTIISLTASEINSKTTEQMTSYNAGVYMSPYYTDENVPIFDEYCQIMAQGNMHPILSINAITDNLFNKIKEVLDKYGLTSKTTIRSYSTPYLQKAYLVFGNNIRYLYDCGAFDESRVSDWSNLDFGGAEKMVGYDWMHNASDAAIDEAINSAFSKGMMIMSDAKDNYELFKKLINKGVREFTVNHFISANML